ncbi:hypothetical protein [Endozoicomonas sp. 8E]|uniref:hypothetical protein n=1 Tax=Endozoicomonas sp. 8E TaxID=3035692 RepID=UPI0029392DF2|nr:hypothetical protein [Endozoicomonas sp. 8E]WOG28919.1 hypothetical protein P6910_04445 [Endozoicomonas sp. 8E]
MIIRKVPILFVALFSISFSVILQAQEELVYVLWSLNSRAEMYLVQRLDNDKPRVLVSIKRDMSIDDAYLDHVGNIASKRTRTDMKSGDYDPSRNAVAVARKMSLEMLAEQKPVLAQKGIDPAKTPASFLYAVAGFDAATAKEGDGLYTFFDPQDVIDIQKQAETAIKETFQNSAIALTDIRTTRDTALIGEAMKLMNAEDELFVFKTTYDLVCSMEQGELKTVDMKMLYKDHKKRAAETLSMPMMVPRPPKPPKSVPSGSIHSIGAFASDRFFSNSETACRDTIETCKRKVSQLQEYDSDQQRQQVSSDAFACVADIKTCLVELIKEGEITTQHYLKQHIDPDASDREFFDRYTQRKRKNELGHRILLLRLQDSEAPAALKEWYVAHMKDTMQPTLNEIEKRAASMIAKAREKGKSNPPHVYFLGEYAEINEIDFVNVLFRERLKEWGLTYSYISKQETDQFIAAGALRVIDSLRQANH